MFATKYSIDEYYGISLIQLEGGRLTANFRRSLKATLSFQNSHTATTKYSIDEYYGISLIQLEGGRLTANFRRSLKATL